MSYGIERLVNGFFVTSITGWNNGAGGNALQTLEWSDGRLHAVASGATQWVTRPIVPAIPAGKAHVFSGKLHVISGQVVTGPNVVTGHPGIQQGPGQWNIGYTWTPNAPFGTWVTYSLGGPAEWYLDNMSLRGVGSDMSKVVLTLRDYDGDKKQTSAELGAVTDGASYVTREAQAAAIRDAVNAVSGNIAGYDFLAQSSEPNNVNTATPEFQTHIRWIVEMVDSVTGDGPYAFDIPTADVGNPDLFLPSSTEHDPAAAEWIALKAAMNGIVINPRTGSPMNITRIYLEE